MSMPNQNPIQDQSSFLNFEAILNNTSEWQSNPIESTRQCLAQLYTLIKSQNSYIASVDRTKATKTELSSSLSIKANVADVMRTFKDVADTISSIPQKEELSLLLDDKVSRKELNQIISSKVSNEQIRKEISTISAAFVTKNEFNDVLSTKADNDNIMNLIQDKPDRDEIEKIFTSKFNAEGLEKYKDVLSNNDGEMKRMAKKIEDIDLDFDRLLDNIKKQFQQINGVLNNLTTNKADYKEIENFVKMTNENINGNKIYDEVKAKMKNDLYENIAKAKNEVIDILSSTEEKLKAEILLHEKNTKEQVDKLSNNLISNCSSLNNDIVKLNNNYTSTVTKKDLEILNQKLFEISNQMKSIPSSSNFVSFNDIDSLYKKILKEVSDKCEEIQFFTQDYIKNFDNDIQIMLDKKANITEINSALQGKSDLNSINSALDKKVSRTEFESLKLSVEKLSQDYINKIDYLKFDSFVNSTQVTLDEVQKDLMMKANIKEMMGYLKNKADIDEVNKALTQVHDELDNKSSIDQFNQAMDNQNAINSAICRENIVGKWVWNSGEVKNGYAVPWEVESVNTSPEIFIWEKDKTNIVVTEKGIYLISIMFFVKDKPTVQILVNGDCALSAVGANAFVVRHEDSSEEAMTGMTMTDYLNLEDKARVTISYSGDDHVKGLLMLKKIS